ASKNQCTVPELGDSGSLARITVGRNDSNRCGHATPRPFLYISANRYAFAANRSTLQAVARRREAGCPGAQHTPALCECVGLSDSRVAVFPDPALIQKICIT